MVNLLSTGIKQAFTRNQCTFCQKVDAHQALMKIWEYRVSVRSKFLWLFNSLDFIFNALDHQKSEL